MCQDNRAQQATNAGPFVDPVTLSSKLKRPVFEAEKSREAMAVAARIRVAIEGVPLSVAEWSLIAVRREVESQSYYQW